MTDANQHLDHVIFDHPAYYRECRQQWIELRYTTNRLRPYLNYRRRFDRWHPMHPDTERFRTQLIFDARHTDKRLYKLYMSEF